MKYIFALLLLTLSLFAYIPPQITYGNDLIGNGSHTFLTDALGSTRGLVDNSGQLTDSYSYTPYGTLSSHKGTSESSFLFTGEQWDSETDNYYLRARYYSPITARFLSRDTYDGKLNDPLSQNHYLYAGGNPVMYVDPSGHFFGGFAGSLGLMTSISSLATSGLISLGVTGGIMFQLRANKNMLLVYIILMAKKVLDMQLLLQAIFMGEQTTSMI